MESRPDLRKLRCDLESCLRASDDLGLFVAGAFIAHALDRMGDQDARAASGKGRFAVARGHDHGR